MVPSLQSLRHGLDREHDLLGYRRVLGLRSVPCIESLWDRRKCPCNTSFTERFGLGSGSVPRQSGEFLCFQGWSRAIRQRGDIGTRGL
ncbi:unnamed protein product [Mycena citricolor]|uniref:Uncharacterized protein n=1 Tax=Mycena citricolor TaxID=2018698 RepID=A0AAD2HKL0_9AGAR|nr:unnamed protein product [Mycena citricolor]